MVINWFLVDVGVEEPASFKFSFAHFAFWICSSVVGIASPWIFSNAGFLGFERATAEDPDGDGLPFRIDRFAHGLDILQVFCLRIER